MPLTREAQQAREAETVRSAPNRPGMHAPDIEAIDKWIRKLYADLHRPNTHPDGQRRIREDLDALLDRRQMLVSVQGLPVT